MNPVAVNLFPINAQVDGQRFDQVRFYSDSDRSELWGLVNGQPTVVASGPGLVRQMRAVGGETFTDGTKVKWTLPLTDGQVWYASPGQGCGCSHPLRHFHPERVAR